MVSFLLLYTLGFVPESIKPQQAESFRTLWDKQQALAIKAQLEKNTQAGITAPEPTRIVIDKINVDVSVSNPNTTDLATLDDYLLRGAVRYPGSGLLGFGNMFIFAHSTGLQVVNNQAFKAFNGLKNLTTGDLIKVYSDSKVSTYRVTSVKMVDQNEALVDFDNNRNMLTLSTCNSFGQKGDRYVVEAEFVSSL
jgi:LPXTG-site transpeptidase (sortase) family protein